MLYRPQRQPVLDVPTCTVNKSLQCVPNHFRLHGLQETPLCSECMALFLSEYVRNRRLQHTCLTSHTLQLRPVDFTSTINAISQAPTASMQILRVPI